MSFSLRLAVVLLCAIWAGGPVLACRLPPPVAALMADIAAPGSPQARATLQARLATLTEAELHRTLTAEGLEPLLPQVLDIVALATRSAAPRRDRLVQMHEDLETGVAALCAARIGIDPQIRSGLLPHVYGAVAMVAERSLRRVAESPPLQAAVLVMALCTAICLMYLGNALFRIAMALIYNRQICRIPATLRLGSDEYSGLVVTLGRGGFRFEREERDAQMPMLQTLDRRRPVLIVQDEEFPAQLSFAGRQAADFRFVRGKLRLADQRRLLRASTITPFAARANRRRHRAIDPQPAPPG